jgi:hypothetical protein
MVTRPGAYRQTEGVLARTLGDEQMLLHPSGTPAISLNSTAAAVWQACAEGAEIPVVVDALSTEYGVEPAAIEQQVHEVVDRLLGLGFLRQT